MFEYKFVTIKLKPGFIRSTPAEHYQEIITKYTKED